MKQILWISRHEMTGDQRKDLERIAGEPITVTAWQDTVQNVADLKPALSDCDMVAAVLPIGKLGELLKLAGGKPVLQAVSKRLATGRTVVLPDGRTEKEFAFVHAGWEQILRVEVETKPL